MAQTERQVHPPDPPEDSRIEIAIAWRIELFGTPCVRRNDGRVVAHFPTQKIASLLAYLAYHLARPHSREQLVELLWPEADPDAGRHSLRQGLFELRRLLEPSGVAAGTVLIADRTTVRLNPAAVTTDVAEYLGAVAAAGKAFRVGERVRLLTEAVERYGGELLPGCYEDWIPSEAERLAESFSKVLRQLIDCLKEAGDLKSALSYAKRAATANLIDEEAHLDLMRLYAALGRHSEALRHYQDLSQLLKREFHSDPSATLRAFARDIECLSTHGCRRRADSIVHFPATSIYPPRSSLFSNGTVPDIPIPFREGSPAIFPIPVERGSRLVTLLAVRITPDPGGNRDHPPVENPVLLYRSTEDILLEYEGRIDHLRSDGFTAIFGMPFTHEDDPERAIRAAMEIRKTGLNLGWTVSAVIDTGEVAFLDAETETSPEHVTFGSTRSSSPDDVFTMRLQAGISNGPVRERATSLLETAAPGEILAGETAYRLTCRAIEFVPVEVDGSRTPVFSLLRAYRVVRRSPHPEKTRGIEGIRAELIGRDEEMARLQASLEAVIQGQGRMVSLIGEAGAGKSRLVDELRQWAESHETAPAPDDLRPLSHRPPLWLEGRCLELRKSTGYSVFVDLFREVLTRRPGEIKRTRVGRMADCLREFAAHGDLSEEQMEEMGPILGNLLSLRFGNDWDRRLGNAPPEQIRHRTLTAIRDFIVVLARRQPLVLVLEDLHWADRLSLDAISLLTEVLSLVPLLLLCVYRPEPEHPCRRLASVAGRKCPGRYAEIDVKELTPQESRRMVESLLGEGAIPVPMQDTIHTRSQGNPFYLEEIVRSFLEAGTIYRDGTAWRARATVEVDGVPESVRSVIFSRVDRLDGVLKAVLQGASVIGRLFSRRVLERVMGDSQLSLEQALWDLEDRQLVYQERLIPEVEYSFQHVLTRETIYESIPRRRRSKLHRKAAESIEALYGGEGRPDDAFALNEVLESLAHHYEQSDDHEKAIEYLLKAGEKARRAYLNDDAIGYFQRALDRLGAERPTDGDRQVVDPFSGSVSRSVLHSRPPEITAHIGLGQIHHGMGNMEAAETHFRQAIALGRGEGMAPRERVRLLYWLSQTLYWQSRYDEMLDIGEEGLALLEADSETVEAALMNHAVASVWEIRGDRIRQRELAYRNARFLRRLPYSEELRPVYLHVAAICKNDANPRESMRWIRALERRAKRHHDLRALAAVYSHMGSLHEYSGNLHERITRGSQAIELFARIGDDKHQVNCFCYTARAYLALGDLTRAEESARHCREAAEKLGNRSDIARSYMVMGTIALWYGCPERALVDFQEATRLYREVGSFGAVEALHALGRCHLALGDRSAAAERFREAIDLAGSSSYAFWAEFALGLSGLEETYMDPGEFVRLCHRLQSEPVPIAAGRPFDRIRWYLEPADPDYGLTIPEFRLTCAGWGESELARRRPGSATRNKPPQIRDLTWHDPFGDCACDIVDDGLVVHAANRRDLLGLNVSAPRLLRPIRGAFAAQTVCLPVSREQPAIGGLLLWKDERNFLRLDRGTRGTREIGFSGQIDNRELLIGRGRLSLPDLQVGSMEGVVLRLERRDGRVSAFCRVDGDGTWFSAGSVEFPVEDPLEIGLHATGRIEPTIYPSANSEGTAIRFASFEIWRDEQTAGSRNIADR